MSIAKADSNLVVVDVPSLAAFWLTLNTTKPPFDNKNLRLALAYALDIDAIVKGVYLGIGVVVARLENDPVGQAEIAAPATAATAPCDRAAPNSRAPPGHAA